MKLATWSIINNEIDFLPLIIPYTASFVDYLYILDTGSTDGSWEWLQEAKKTFSNLVVEKYKESFIPQYDLEWEKIPQPFPEVEVRNFAIERCKLVFPETDWMIQLDGDEIFLTETRKVIETYHQDSRCSFITLSTINPVCDLKYHPLETRRGKILYDPHARVWRKDAGVKYLSNPEINGNVQYHCIPTLNNKHLYLNYGNIFLEDKVHFHLHWLYGKKIESFYSRQNIFNKKQMIANQYKNDFSNLVPEIFWKEREKWINI